MKTEDLVEMIEKSGLCEPRKFIDNFVQLERFDALVASAEREACAKLCDERAQKKDLSNHRRCDADLLARSIRERGQA